MAILSVNAGSSTLKFSLYPLVGAQVQPQILSGCIEGLEPDGKPEMSWSFQGQTQRKRLELGVDRIFAQALQCLRELLSSLPDTPSLQAVAHRVVHGGASYRASVVVTEAVLANLTRLSSLAPLHQPHNLAGVRSFTEAFAGVPQVACFDTAFHATLPEVDYRFALPEALYERGLRRYGFHGLSYQYVMGVLLAQSPRAAGRVLMAHLGNGASLCGTINGQSRATTMGFSALDGLMMGTRTGALDAGVMLYLLEQGWSHDQLQTLLYKQSGLLGVSGISADMRRLRADTSAAAQLAVDMFTYRIQRESGALVACLQGLDVLAFSGGIGEHDVTLRTELGQRLAWLGVVIDPQRNAQATGDQVLAIHASSSAVEVWVVPTDEGVVAAREAANLLAA
ncbi:MAG: acetate/propionate family kinase [Betaproteobacteria bacterium]|nr:acetate/propionate family kinase [Betaproteobacteria bacterium]NCP82305.1 acetate/propionate family kinase [Rhodoferax sp.]OIP21631.1 MAG: acetate kinase [Comamonadaceae bacterium CG2_30_57_122]PIZ23464.1 MAG: acetate kinase [Comamonadaceae bacterium CG_4_10_14_0_8_um_filter_57_29]PJC14416.1 MAG: acetate kinase [Comamonadaceae bacterium CG_4_9_14_0_8_um_filter_57_21]